MWGVFWHVFGGWWIVVGCSSDACILLCVAGYFISVGIFWILFIVFFVRHCNICSSFILFSVIEKGVADFFFFALELNNMNDVKI